jgi:hypothetical protein
MTAMNSSGSTASSRVRLLGFASVRSRKNGVSITASIPPLTASLM